MSTSSSDWSKFREENTQTVTLVETIVKTILEIINSVLCIQIEKEAFTELGCYLYRASIVLIELHINWSTPTNEVETLHSLQGRLDSVKTLTTNLEQNSNPISPSQVRNVVQELETLIRIIGESLGTIPSSAYGDQACVEKTAKALSKEMRDVSFSLSLSQNVDAGNTGTVYVRHVERVQPPHGVDSKASGKGIASAASAAMKEERQEMEMDLYSTDADVSAMSLQLSDSSQMYLTEIQESSKMNNLRNDGRGSSLMSLPQLAQYMEPMYETFFCPLTKKMMDDPVTVESGVTYERKAITEWFDKLEEKQEDLVCPKSGQKLKTRVLNTNVALKATIAEWKERNEAARIKVARAALSLASTENMVLKAIDDLRSICKSKPYNKVQIRNIGMISVLAKFLEYKNRSIRCATLELLRHLAEDDEEGKDSITKTVDISAIVKMLSSSHKPIRHESTLLLLELSKSQMLCEKIGSVAGGILMLITVKYRQSLDAFLSEKADEILKNLETFPNNIKLMAENGYWEPLLTHLVEGSEEMRMETASYLGEVVLGPDCKSYVAERSSPALIQMVQSGNSLSRHAAFKALKQISGYHPNAKILVEAGIMQIMVEEMFARTIHNEPMNSKTEAAAILANILESGLDVEGFQVNAHGHAMSSDYIVYNIIYRIKNSTPDELNINLIRVLLSLIKLPKASGTIVSVVKETEASYNLIELINTPNEELGVASIKLLIILSSFMGHTLSDRLCKTQGQPEGLIKNPTDATRITEKDSVSATFLAKLPHQNLTLNLALVNRNIIPTVLQNINRIQRTGTRTSRHVSAYFEGLVGVLVRLTTTLYDHQILFTARTNNFTMVFAELLTKSFTDEVQRLSAVGLENLSKQSINLSRPPPKKKRKILKLFVFHKCMSINLSKKEEEISVCPIHGGVCSSEDTFCLVDAEGVERLLACLDHENVHVIEAALSALSTLLDDKVNVDKSVTVLSEKHAVRYVLSVVKDHKEEVLYQKAFWIIERFLTRGGNESASSIWEDRLLPSILVSAFHHGDESTRETAGKLLRHLNMMPTLSNTMTFTKQ